MDCDTSFELKSKEVGSHKTVNFPSGNVDHLLHNHIALAYNAMKKFDYSAIQIENLMRQTRTYVVIVDRSISDSPGPQKLCYWTIPIHEFSLKTKQWHSPTLPKSIDEEIPNAFQKLYGGTSNLQQDISLFFSVILPKFAPHTSSTPDPNTLPQPDDFFSNKKAPVLA